MLEEDEEMISPMDSPGVPLTPELHVRRNLDLKVTVVGRQLEDQILAMVESGEDITLNCDEQISLSVVNVARYDGLPLGVEKMFDMWFRLSGLRDSLREPAKAAYLSGMKAAGIAAGRDGNGS